MTVLEILDVLADRKMAGVSTRRLAEIREGRQELLDEDDFLGKGGSHTPAARLASVNLIALDPRDVTIRTHLRTVSGEP